MTKFAKKVGNYRKIINNYFNDSTNKPWSKENLNYSLGINRQFIYDLKSKKIKRTKEIEKFLHFYNEALDKIESDIIKDFSTDKRLRYEYWKFAYQLPREKNKDNYDSNITININLDKPREIE